MIVHFNKAVPDSPQVPWTAFCGFSAPGNYSNYQNEVTCKTCLQILKRANELEAMTEEELDEQVHDCKSAEAAEINNQGREAQIAYLLS